MNGFKIDIDEIPDNYVFQCNQKIITQIIKDQDEATIKIIQRYCEENDIIPNIISEDKLRLVLELGIAELKKRELEKEVSKLSEEDDITIRINQINDILESAIRYGGDCGGIYCDEEYKKELIKNLQRWINWQGYEDKLFIYFDNDIPKILIKENIINKGSGVNE